MSPPLCTPAHSIPHPLVQLVPAASACCCMKRRKSWHVVFKELEKAESLAPDTMNPSGLLKGGLLLPSSFSRFDSSQPLRRPSILTRHGVNCWMLTSPPYTVSKDLNMVTRRRIMHSKKQKEVARKRGSSYLRKGVQLGQKANIIAGGFYQEPTHRRRCVSCYIPEGCEVPDLRAIVCLVVMSLLVFFSLKTNFL